MKERQIMKKIKIFEKLSILPQGIRHKLLIAFCLMSIIPLLVIGYLINNVIVLGEQLGLSQVSVVILFCIIIAWLGLYIAKSIMERIIDISMEGKAIAGGDYMRKVKIQTGDEIGQIGETINFLAQKIRGNMADIKDYQSKMKEVNAEIQKKVSVLSNVLQIGELISSSVKLENVLELALSRLSQQYATGFAALYTPEEGGKKFKLLVSDGLKNDNLSNATIKEGEGFLGKAIQRKKYVVIDASTRFSSEEQGFKSTYKCGNMVGYPLVVSRNVRGLLVVGNNLDNFTYTSDDIEYLKVFAEQVSIAIENDVLLRKARKLEIKDDLTGLFNKSYIVNRLSEEIERAVAAQRPCSYLVFDLDDFKKYEEEKGPAQAEIALKKIAHAISRFSFPAGKVGRTDTDTFALILPEANKKEALEIAEKIRKKIESTELSSEKGDRLTASGGISENPLDGSTAEEIIEKAEGAIKKAKEIGKNKVLTLGV